ncbi:NAD(P)/FAD-dependent oxidoreductase [Rhodococcus koreensis]
MVRSDGNAVVIVGASAAGLAAADGLREGGHTGSIIVLDSEAEPGYDRPMLSKSLLATKGNAEPRPLRTREHMVDRGIEVLPGHGAVGLDIDRRLVVTNWGEAIAWEQLVIATGVTARPVVTTGGVTLPSLRTRVDLDATRALAVGGKPVTLIGAGFIGLEVAAALRLRGVNVIVIGQCELPLAAFVGDEAARWLRDLHLAHGATLELGAATTAVTETTTGHAIRLADGRELHVDSVLAGIGSDPATDWLLGSGVELDAGVVTDTAGRTNVPGVWAAGDVASTLDPRLGRHRRFEHWTHAIEQGRHVGLNLARRTSEPYTAVPYVWTEQYGHTVHMLGERRPGDTDLVIEGDVASGEFVLAHGSDNELHGATICGRIRALRTFKKLLRAGATLDDAVGAATPA